MRPLLLIQWTSVTIFAIVWTRRAARAFTPPSLRAYYRANTVAQTTSARHLSTESPDEDLLRWEKMYFDGKTESSSIMDEGNAIDYYSSATEVRVITFDLDNCLWRTGDTISAANDALAEFLDGRNVTQPIRVENVMGELFKESKEKYSPNGGKAPVLLTKLRKDAIQRVLQEHNDYLEEEAKELADEAFEVWTKTRHDAIPSHFASSVVSCLEEIRSMPTSSGQPVLIGAVTDGNSDPRNVNDLRDLFDFCVNAEFVGVAKPDKRMYVEAMNIVTQHPHVQDIFGPIQSNLSEDAIEDIIGPWWVHVGDDFIKDVVPAKELKMRSIWARELVLSKSENKDKVQRPKKSLEEFVKEVADKKIIEMTVGSDDYLVDSIRREFADAVVDDFGELSKVLFEWQQTALRRAENVSTDEEEIKIGAETVAAVHVVPAKPTEADATATDTNEKFCMYCGVKLPMAAKFCSSCGEKQP